MADIIQRQIIALDPNTAAVHVVAGSGDEIQRDGELLKASFKWSKWPQLLVLVDDDSKAIIWDTDKYRRVVLPELDELRPTPPVARCSNHQFNT